MGLAGLLGLGRRQGDPLARGRSRRSGRSGRSRKSVRSRRASTRNKKVGGEVH